jgi:hypothetical protein
MKPFAIRFSLDFTLDTDATRCDAADGGVGNDLPAQLEDWKRLARRAETDERANHAGGSSVGRRPCVGVSRINCVTRIIRAVPDLTVTRVIGAGAGPIVRVTIVGILGIARETCVLDTAALVNVTGIEHAVGVKTIATIPNGNYKRSLCTACVSDVRHGAARRIGPLNERIRITGIQISALTRMTVEVGPHNVRATHDNQSGDEGTEHPRETWFHIKTIPQKRAQPLDLWRSAHLPRGKQKRP